MLGECNAVNLSPYRHRWYESPDERKPAHCAAPRFATAAMVTVSVVTDFNLKSADGKVGVRFKITYQWHMRGPLLWAQSIQDTRGEQISMSINNKWERASAYNAPCPPEKKSTESFCAHEQPEKSVLFTVMVFSELKDHLFADSLAAMPTGWLAGWITDRLTEPKTTSN